MGVFGCVGVTLRASRRDSASCASSSGGFVPGGPPREESAPVSLSRNISSPAEDSAVLQV